MVLAIAAVAAGLYFVATTLFGPGEPPQPASEPLTPPLPRGRALTAADVRAATFPVAVRGYRMSDVDALLERLAAELERQEQLLRELDSSGGHDGRSTGLTAGPDARPDECGPTEP